MCAYMYTSGSACKTLPKTGQGRGELQVMSRQGAGQYHNCTFAWLNLYRNQPVQIDCLRLVPRFHGVLSTVFPNRFSAGEAEAEQYPASWLGTPLLSLTYAYGLLYDRLDPILLQSALQSRRTDSAEGSAMSQQPLP